VRAFHAGPGGRGSEILQAVPSFRFLLADGQCRAQCPLNGDFLLDYRDPPRQHSDRVRISLEKGDWNMSRVARACLLAVVPSLAIASTPALSNAGVKNFMAVLSGAQETPPNASTALGNALLTFDTATNTLCYSISFNLPLLGGGEIVAHIHGPAAPGVPGGVILPLPLGNPKTACIVAPPLPFDKKGLLKNLYYINIHSGGFPAGEIRGQILRIK
jgi:hypothetical protein